MSKQRAEPRPTRPLNERTERIDALTNGVFAIAATLLVLEVRVPEIAPGHSSDDLWRSLLAVAPSFVAFAFSFLTILVYWLNHHALSRVIHRYTYRLVWLNLLLLFWISMIPFTTKFIAEYPYEPAAAFTYGLVMFLTGVTGLLAYCYAAFWSDVMSASIPRASRVRLLKKWIAGPLLYLIAMLAALVNLNVALGIYIAVPLLFFVPTLQESVIEDLSEGDGAREPASTAERA